MFIKYYLKPSPPGLKKKKDQLKILCIDQHTLTRLKPLSILDMYYTHTHIYIIVICFILFITKKNIVQNHL